MRAIPGSIILTFKFCILQLCLYIIYIILIFNLSQKKELGHAVHSSGPLAQVSSDQEHYWSQSILLRVLVHGADADTTGTVDPLPVNRLISACQIYYLFH